MKEDDWRRGLVELAWAAGIEPEYYDTGGGLHHASVDTLLSVLSIWGMPLVRLADVPDAWTWWHERQASTVVEPALAAREGQPLGLQLRLPAGSSNERVHATLQCEDGTELDLGVRELSDHDRRQHGPIETWEWWLSFPGERPVGYHRLVLDIGAEQHESLVFAAPRAVLGFEPAARAWGAFAPMYSLRARADLSSFGRLAEWIAASGGSVMATLPVLASFLDEPYAPSPYTPVSRRFWNEIFLDLDRLADGQLGDAGRRAELATVDEPGPFRYGERAEIVHRVLGDLDPLPPGGSGAMPDVERYAVFRAIAAQQHAGWNEWPDRLRAGDVREGDYDPAVAARHVLAQNAMRTQLVELTDAMLARGQRLYLDLPIGAHPHGFDTWTERDLFAPGAATGAPPDDFFSGGQNWGFPPVRPDASRRQGHAHFRDCLRHHMEIAGILRLDHVMGLHRLYWVPDGMDATEGAYVRYPRDELFAVLAIESHRHDCIVVGEDLGTVPDEVRDAMARHEVLGMYVAEFMLPTEVGAPIGVPRARAVASIDTHDTPTFAGFSHGLDIAQRVETQLLDVHDAHHEFEARESQIDNLRVFLAERGLLEPSADDQGVLVGLLRFLGGSDAPCVLVSLEDLWGEAHPQNVPGTPADRPNWVQRFPFDLDALADLPQVKDAVVALDRARKDAVP